MPWISLAARRPTFRRFVEEAKEEPGYADSALTVVSSSEALYALLAGDDEWSDVEARRAAGMVKKLRGRWKAPPAESMWKVFGLAVAASLAGEDPAPDIGAIAGARYREASDKSLQLVARRIAGLEESPRKPYGEPGHVGKESEWYKLVREAPAAHALDLALTPDHPLWRTLAPFALPLAYLVAQERARRDRSADLKLLMRLGAHPERRGRILHEREDERPDFKADATPEERDGWTGFDAVEERDGKLFAYYYLGIRFKAPLVFQDDLNTYDFLERVGADWKRVRKAVSADTWREIERGRDDCQYVVVYDSYDAEAPEGHSEAAAEHYGLNLEARDLTEV